jgi:hypothetical protein
MSDIKAGFVWSDKAENFANNKAMALRLNKTIGEATVTQIAGETNLGPYLVEGPNGSNFNNWFDIVDVMQPNGGLGQVVTIEGGSGYANTNPIPVTISGGTGSGATAVAVAGGLNGKIAYVLVTSPGSGYRVVSREVGLPGIVSGSAVIKINNGFTNKTKGIAAGMSVSHPLFPDNTLVSSVDAAAGTVTCTQNATGSANYDWVAFGVPKLTFSGGGSGWKGFATVGSKKVYRLPAGYYRGNANMPSVQNAVLRADGATIAATARTQTGLTMHEWCANFKIEGLEVRNEDADIISPPENRGTGHGIVLAGYNIDLLNTSTVNIPNWGVVLGRKTDNPDYFQGYKIIGHTSEGSGGDGIHVSNSVRDVQITSFTAINLGDDAIAVFPEIKNPDEDANYIPKNVSINGVVIRNNSWRGIMVIEAEQVSITGVVMQGLGGYGLEIEKARDVAFSGLVFNSIGNPADGYRPTTPARYPIKIHNSSQRISGSSLAFSDIAAGTLIEVTGSTDVLINAQTIQGKSLFTGSGNTNVTVGS